jgi:hypothetical protein
MRVRYSLPDIKEIIKDNSLQYVRVYEGYLSVIPDEKLPVHVIDCTPGSRSKYANKSLYEALEPWLNRFNVPVTLYFGVTNNSRNSNILVFYEPNLNAAPVVNSESNMQPVMNGQMLNYAVQIAELRSEIQMMNLRREKEDLEKEIENRENSNEKLKAVGSVIFERLAAYFFPGVPSVQPLQGTENENEQLEIAVAYLIETFDVSGVIRLAQLLQNKPEFVSIVKSQIN